MEMNARNALIAPLSRYRKHFPMQIPICLAHQCDARINHKIREPS
jgi:hypothetical protein